LPPKEQMLEWVTSTKDWNWEKLNASDKGADGILWFKDRLVVPKDFEFRRKIMDEVHCSRYYIHSGTNKMYQDLKKNFWWTRMKR
jgi:hypothetical protein